MQGKILHSYLHTNYEGPSAKEKAATSLPHIIYKHTKMFPSTENPDKVTVQGAN